MATLTGAIVTLLGMATFLLRLMPGVAPLATIFRVILVAVAVWLIAGLVDPAGLGLVALYAALGGGTMAVLVMTGDLSVPALGSLRMR
jgi:hypothetical protein